MFSELEEINQVHQTLKPTKVINAFHINMQPSPYTYRIELGGYF